MLSPKNKLPDKLAAATGLPRSRWAQILRVLTERSVISSGRFSYNERDAARLVLSMASDLHRNAPEVIASLGAIDDGQSNVLDAIDQLAGAATRRGSTIDVEWSAGSLRLGRSHVEAVLRAKIGGRDVKRDFSDPAAATYRGARTFVELPLIVVRDIARAVMTA